MRQKNLFLSFLVVLLSGCASSGSYQLSGFLPSEPALTKGKFFHLEYVAPGVDFARFQRFQLAEINLGHLTSHSEIKSRQLEALKTAFRESLEQEVGALYKMRRPEIPAGKGTVVIKTALTWVGPSYRVLQLGSSVIGGPVTMGTAAFEARIEDGATGELLVIIAEKRSAKGKGFTLKGRNYFSTSYPHAEKAFEIWANQLQKLMLANSSR